MRTAVVGENKIFGVFYVVESHNPNSSDNKMFWLFKGPIIKQIAKLMAGCVPSLTFLQSYADGLEPVHVLSTKFSRDQGIDDLLHRIVGSNKYPYEALGFCIDGAGKVTGADELFEVFANAVHFMVKQNNFRSLYQQIVDAQNNNFGNSIRKKDQHWSKFRRVTTVKEVSHLNQVLPDEDIIRLVSAELEIEDPRLWPADVVGACWREGLPGEYHQQPGP